MNKYIKQLWLDALESGKYQQCQHQLCVVENMDDKYCCLGVLTDLYIQSLEGQVNNAQWELNSTVKIFKSKTCGGQSKVLPHEVSEWAGLNGTSNPMIKHDAAAGSCGDLNDNGHTFQYIANCIKEVL